MDHQPKRQIIFLLLALLCGSNLNAQNVLISREWLEGKDRISATFSFDSQNQRYNIVITGDGTHFLADDGRAQVYVLWGTEAEYVNYYVPQNDTLMEAVMDLSESSGGAPYFYVENKADGVLHTKITYATDEPPENFSPDSISNSSSGDTLIESLEITELSDNPVQPEPIRRELRISPMMGFTGEKVSTMIFADGEPKFNLYMDSLVVTLHSIVLKKPAVRVLGPNRLLVDIEIPANMYPGLHTLYIYSGPSMNQLLKQGEFMVIGSKVVDHKIISGSPAYGKEFTVEFRTFHTQFRSPDNLPKVTIKGSAYFYCPSFTTDKIEVLEPGKFRAHFTIPHLAQVLDKMKTVFKPDYVTWSYQIESPREGIIESKSSFEIKN